MGDVQRVEQVEVFELHGPLCLRLCPKLSCTRRGFLICERRCTGDLSVPDSTGANTYEPDEGKGRGMFGNATMNFGNTVSKEAKRGRRISMYSSYVSLKHK